MSAVRATSSKWLPPHVATNQVTCVTLADCLVRKTELSFRITATKVKTPQKSRAVRYRTKRGGLTGTKMLGELTMKKYVHHLHTEPV